LARVLSVRFWEFLVVRMSMAFFGASPARSLVSQLEGLVGTSSHTLQTLGTSLADSDGSQGAEDTSDIANLPKVRFRNSWYTLESLLAKKGSRGRFSWIKDEGLYVREILEGQRLGKAFWVCRRCDEKLATTLFAADATNSASSHLKKKHRVLENSRDSTGASSESSDTPTPLKIRRSTMAISRARTDMVEDLALGFIVNSNQPFNIFNDPFLKVLLHQMDPALCEQVSWGRDALKRKLWKTFDIKKCEIQQELAGAVSRVHIAYDLWTSPNRIAILGVSAHFIDPQGTQQQRLLALRQQYGSHTGENIAKTLAEVLKSWDIVNLLGTIVSDNASNNDVCGHELFKQLIPEYTPEDVVDRRMRCYGHILNLVGRAFLYGEDSESFEQESQGLEALDRIDNDLQHWRKKGPIGKLHNFVKWVRSTPQRSEYFKLIVKDEEANSGYSLAEESTAELELVLNNETRWNSTYLMIERALKKQGDIEIFLIRNSYEQDPGKRIPAEDVLTPEDWLLLVELRDILEPIYRQTMRTQGRGKRGHLWEVLTGVEFLLERLEEWKAFFDDPDEADVPQSQALLPTPRQRSARSRTRRSSLSYLPSALPEHSRPEYVESRRQQRFEGLATDSRRYFRLSVLNGWKKLNEYYIKLGDSPLFAAAVILDPRLGLRWLEAQWVGSDQFAWIREAKEGLYRYWDRWYRDGQPLGVSRPSRPSPPRGDFASLANISRTSPINQFDDWVLSRRPRSPSDDSELDKYLRLDAGHFRDVKDPVSWWLSQREAFPTVSQLALDLLAIPAMSADCERVFSLAKLTLTSQRLAMASTTLEHIQCLKNWARRGSISLGGQYFGRQGR
jgi:hypothetical protein